MKPSSIFALASLASLSFVSIAAAVMIVVPTWWVWMYQGPSGGGTDYCYETQQIPADVHPSPEAQGGFIELGWMPYGIGCEWVLTDGTIVFVPSNEPLPSFLLYGGAVGVVASLVCGARHRISTSRA